MPTGAEPTDTGSLAVAQAERVSERLGQRRAQASSAAASAQRWRQWLFLGIPVAVGLSLLVSVVAVVIAVNASRPVAGEVAVQVAREVTPEVTRQVVEEARAGRADTARRLLAEQNARLAARGLPIVADPGPAVTADEVVGAWITARVLGTLPPTVTDELAAQVSDGRAPRVLPSASLPLDPSALGDVTVTVLPGVEPLPRSARPVTPPRRSSDGGSGPASPRPGPATARPAPAPAPAPAAPQPDRGLLRPCLLGTVLC